MKPPNCAHGPLTISLLLPNDAPDNSMFLASALSLLNLIRLTRSTLHASVSTVNNLSLTLLFPSVRSFRYCLRGSEPGFFSSHEANLF